MPLIRPGVRRLFDLMLRRPDVRRRDVDAEIALHIELRVQQLVRQGLDPHVARAEAERRFGSVRALQSLEQMAHWRDQRMSLRDWLDSVRQDVRYALRGLRREPAFTGFAIATLALGIGANAAMFGVVDRLLVRGPDHVKDPDRLVRFTATVTRQTTGEVTDAGMGYVVYDNFRKSGSPVFDGYAAYTSEGTYALGRGHDARTIRGGAASADFFSLLGVRPARGRFFSPDEDDTSNPAHVVVLGEALWQSQFGADEAILGKTVHINDEPHTVIGIAPRGFTGVQLSRVDAWIPMSLGSRTVTDNWPRAWNAQWLYVIGRMKPGISLEAATAEATRIHQLAYDGPPTYPFAKARIGATPIRFTLKGKESTEASVAKWLIGVTLVVLLIACSNVANLLLSRAIKRQGEVGLRMALGAGRGRLARLFVTESLVLSALGGAAALAVAAGISILVRKELLAQIEWTSSPVSTRVLIVALAVTFGVGLLVGLAPAAHAARVSLHSAMQRGRAQGRRWRAGSWPTILQATLTACLLIGAGLFVRSLHRARTLPLGFESERILVVQPWWTRLGLDATTADRVAARARRIDASRRALERLQQRRDVEYAAIAVGSPFGNGFGVDLFVPGFDSLPTLPGGGPFISAVTADYFSAVRTKLLRGRTFTPSDGPGSARVTIVNATMARALWPNEDALTKCMRIHADTMPCAPVVGVVEDAHRWSLNEQPAMQYYIPFGQEVGFGGSVFMIRPRGTPQSFAAQATRTVAETDAVFERATAWPLRERIDPLLRPWKLGATIFAMGGVLALLVAALGLYSVMSYSVAQRTHELGVRIALGARSQSIISMIVRQGVVLAAVGVAAGIVLAILAGSRLQGLLFDTSPRDATIIGGAALVLMTAAAAASFWPALRAGRVDPIRALKSD
jgi:predicted permease